MDPPSSTHHLHQKRLEQAMAQQDDRRAFDGGGQEHSAIRRVTARPDSASAFKIACGARVTPEALALAHRHRR